MRLVFPKPLCPPNHTSPVDAPTALRYDADKPRNSLARVRDAKKAGKSEYVFGRRVRGVEMRSLSRAIILGH